MGEFFSEIVNNAARHEASSADAIAQRRFMPRRRGPAVESVIAGSGAATRDPLPRNPELEASENDAKAIGLPIQESVSGTGGRNPGLGLWVTVTEMRRQGRKLWLHSGTAF